MGVSEKMSARKHTRKVVRRVERKPERLSALDREKQSLRSRLQSIEGELSGASSLMSSVESGLNYVNGAMATIPVRLSKVRSQGYECLSHLEKSLDLLTSKWAESSIQQDFLYNVQPLRSEVSRLR